MLKKLTSMLTTGVALAALAAAPGLTYAQNADQGSVDDQQSPGTMQHHMQGAMHAHMPEGHHRAECDEASKEDHEGMMERMKQMHAQRLQQQAELEDLEARMNAATGEAQQQLMVELLSKLVEARGAMAAMPMHSMMPKMMESMHSGDHGGMSDCPMMKGDHDGDAARMGAEDSD